MQSWPKSRFRFGFGSVRFGIPKTVGFLLYNYIKMSFYDFFEERVETGQIRVHIRIEQPKLHKRPSNHVPSSSGS